LEASRISQVHKPSRHAYEGILNQILCLGLVACQEIGEAECIGGVDGVKLSKHASFDRDRIHVYLLHPRPPPS
jgi:hypothetical protein